jgi:hypothetical protein
VERNRDLRLKLLELPSSDPYPLEVVLKLLGMYPSFAAVDVDMLPSGG